MPSGVTSWTERFRVSWLTRGKREGSPCAAAKSTRPRVAARHRATQKRQNPQSASKRTSGRGGIVSAARRSSSSVMRASAPRVLQACVASPSPTAGIDCGRLKVFHQFGSGHSNLFRCWHSESAESFPHTWDRVFHNARELPYPHETLSRFRESQFLLRRAAGQSRARVFGALRRTELPIRLVS